MCGHGEIPHPQEASLQTPAGCPTISLNSDTTWREHQSQTALKFTCQCQAQVLPMLLTHWLYWKILTALSLGSINLPDWLTELRETFLFLDCPCIPKDCNKEQPEGRGAEGRVWGKGKELPALS